VAATFGWDEADQRARYRRGCFELPTQIIVVDGADAGVLCVESRASDEYLRRIVLHPRVQRRGIGAAITRAVVERAQARGVPTVLRVFKVNVGARRLYQRLGFVVVGESETHYDMRCG
jgi:ribosomal protein S18 acetylase RimI-like enzyme